MTFEEFIEETRNNYFNKLCISSYGTSIVRVVGVADDGDDYYYITCKPGDKEIYESAVMNPILLKGIDEVEYQSLDNFFSINGAGPIDEMIILTSKYQMRQAKIDNDFERFITISNSQAKDEQWIQGAKAAFQFFYENEDYEDSI